MKILIDECLPRKLKAELTDHDVQTIPEVGWAGKKNGELLNLMSGIYDVFITVDSNMQYQQALAQAKIGFIVLSARNNKLATLIPLMSQVRSILETLETGQVIKVSDMSEGEP